MATGVVKWFNSRKGFGFITPDGENAKDVFFHANDLVDIEFESLNEGELAMCRSMGLTEEQFLAAKPKT